MADNDGFTVFDLGFKIPGPEEIGPPLTDASAVLNGLKSKAVSHVEQQLQDAAQSTASLLSKADNRLADSIADAQVVYERLQNAAEQQLANRLASAQEYAAQLPQPPEHHIDNATGISSGQPQIMAGETSASSPTSGIFIPPQPPVVPTLPMTGEDFAASQLPPHDCPQPTVPGPPADHPEYIWYVASCSWGPPPRVTPSVVNDPGTPPKVGWIPPPVGGPLPGQGIAGVTVQWNGTLGAWEPIPLPQSAASAPQPPVNIIPVVDGITPPQDLGYEAIPFAAPPGFEWRQCDMRAVFNTVNALMRFRLFPIGAAWSPECGGASTPIVPPTGSCPCCCCNHSADTTCPPGTVRKDGECLTPQQVETSRAKKFGAYYLEAIGSCTTAEILPGVSPPSGDLVGVGATAEEARLAASAVCRPAIQLATASPPSGKTGTVPFQCGKDLYFPNDASTFKNVLPGDGFLSSFLGIPRGSSLAKEISKRKDVASKLIGETLRPMSWGFDHLVSILDYYSAELLKSGNCVNANFGTAVSSLTISGILEKYVGGPWDYVEKPLDYMMKAACPLIFPSADQAQAAYLANKIPLSLFKNWVEINGVCYEPFAKVTEAAESKPVPLELIQLVRRQIITEEQFDSRMRGLGYVQEQYRKELRQLGEQVPTMSDLITMMKRDADDTDLVERFGMDSEFELKYADQLKKWSRDQGITDKHMRYIWRSHWSIPSPGQLFEFYHRLTRLPEGDPAKVNIGDIKAALIQQDILPFWIDKFLAVSFRPLTRVDARRAFEIGAVDRATLKNSYLDLGYNDGNAEMLVKFNEKNKLKQGYRHSSVAQYVAGIISETMLREDLADDGFAADAINMIVIRAFRKFRFKANTACQKSIKKRLMIRELDHNKTVQQLIDIGYDMTQAETLVKAWECEAKAAGREITAAQLPRYLEAGVITPDDYVSRLERMGYSKEDAVRILTDVNRNIGIKLGRKEAATQKQQQAEQLKQLRDKERTAKEIERQGKQALTASRAASEAKKRRDKSLVAASSKYGEQEGFDVATAFDYLFDQYGKIRRDYVLSPDEATQVIVLAVEKRPAGDTSDISIRIAAMANAMSTIEPETPVFS